MTPISTGGKRPKRQFSCFVGTSFPTVTRRSPPSGSVSQISSGTTAIWIQRSRRRLWPVSPACGIRSYGQTLPIRPNERRWQKSFGKNWNPHSRLQKNFHDIGPRKRSGKWEKFIHFRFMIMLLPVGLNGFVRKT